MSDIYKCECGHTVLSDSTDTPQSLNWSDGHVCVLIKQEEGRCDKCNVVLNPNETICGTCLDSTEGREQHFFQIKKESI